MEWWKGGKTIPLRALHHSNLPAFQSCSIAVGGHQAAARTRSRHVGQRRPVNLRRQQGHLIHQVPPALPLSGRHLLPPFSVLQKQSAFVRTKSGELLKRANALRALGQGQGAISAQGSLELLALRLRKGFEEASRKDGSPKSNAGRTESDREK